MKGLLARGQQRLQGESAADPTLAGDESRFVERAQVIAAELTTEPETRVELAGKLAALRSQLDDAGS